MRKRIPDQSGIEKGRIARRAETRRLTGGRLASIRLGSALTETTSSLQENTYEQAYLPAQQNQKEAHPRLSRPFPHQGRPGRSAPPPSEGAQEISPLGWPKSRRLPDSKRFGACYDQGRKLFTRHFVLFCLKRDETEGSLRLGLTVSRKVGRAVVRNRVRRVLREFFRLHQAMLERPIDIVVVPKRNLDPKSIDMALVEQEFLPVLDRLGREAGGGMTDARSPC
jgi:ribonuclease P protein component